MTKIWRYMELEKIQHLLNEGRELLGRYIYWTEKRDGSCLAVWLKSKSKFRRFLNKIQRKKPVAILHPDYTLIISSRNMEMAEKSICNDFKMTDDFTRVKQYLRDNPTHIVFGEILRKGLSPTRIENHEKVEFIVFDIFDGTHFLGYQQVHQFCFHYDNMKCVRLFGEGRFTSMESLYAFRDQMLEICKQEKREGVVLKAFDDDGKPLYAKEKLDTATPRGHPKIEKGRPEYPPLPLSEAMGAIDKVYADLGQDFTNKAKAMPMVAKYIKEEMKKHQCSGPEGSFYGLYCEYCQYHDIQEITTITKVTKEKKKSIVERIIDKIYYAFLNAWDETNNRLRGKKKCS